ncbi:5-bromo-4-chloroindolyl phosphate hydrolysis family protein [Hutsoniella sourekii]
MSQGKDKYHQQAQQTKRQFFLSTGLAIFAFVFLYLWLDWGLIISLILSIGIYLGIYYYTQPAPLYEDLEAIRNKYDGELYDLFMEATEEMARIEELSQAQREAGIQAYSQEIVATGWNILKFLEKNPKKISQSRHFLTYYLPTTRELLANYSQLQAAGLTDRRLQEVREDTQESCKLLAHLYQQQLDNYYQDQITQLEIENDLLEKTIQLGSDSLEE